MDGGRRRQALSTGPPAGGPGVEDLLREVAPQVVGVLARRTGDFASAEDAVQEALLAAHAAWTRDGIPAQPRAWLVTAATRRFLDAQRSEKARSARERAWAAAQPGGADVVHYDDTLTVLLMCCHPVLTPASAVALTLRAVAGLTTAEIAAAYVVPEATMAQRISRAKRQVRHSGQAFSLPDPDELDERVARVLAVLYLLYNEGYAATSGPQLTRTDLSAESIRLARLTHRLVPGDPEVTALLALLLLLEARRPARVGADGEVVPLPEQDRSLWDLSLVSEGTALLDSTVGHGPTGVYQLQAAIAAVHDRATRAEDTDWSQVLALYGLLERIAPSPFVTLARAVALAEVEGPDAADSVLDGLEGPLGGHHRLRAVRGHVAELRGDRTAARRHYLDAARLTTNLAEQRHLTARAAGLIWDA
ncbi:MAG TPA: sigma-70 family RNA polymerase sigma factor [Ornithinibacter sp.]|nr:sigma-70 family RNA polymerase sigma factor [Ornithinibacter sp.]